MNKINKKYQKLKIVSNGKEENAEEITEVVKKSLGKVLSKIPLIGAAMLGVGLIDRRLSGDFKGNGLEILSGVINYVTGKGAAICAKIDANNVKGCIDIKNKKIFNQATYVNNLDDLIQLQTTESDNTRVNDVKYSLKLQELNKNMKKVDDFYTSWWINMRVVDLTKDLSNFKYTDYDKVDGAVDFIPNVDAQGFTKNFDNKNNSQFVGVNGLSYTYPNNKGLNLTFDGQTPAGVNFLSGVSGNWGQEHYQGFTINQTNFFVNGSDLTLPTLRHNIDQVFSTSPYGGFHLK